MSTFKVADVVFFRGFRRDAEVTGVRDKFGETVYDLRVGHLIGSAPESELSFERCIYVTDLTLDELREWIADWLAVDIEIGDSRAERGFFRNCLSPLNYEEWFRLRFELLDAYADRLRESVQP